MVDRAAEPVEPFGQGPVQTPFPPQPLSTPFRVGPVLEVRGVSADG